MDINVHTRRLKAIYLIYYIKFSDFHQSDMSTGLIGQIPKMTTSDVLPGQ